MKTTANYFPVPGQQFRLTLGGGHVGVDVSGPLRLARWARGLDGDDGPRVTSSRATWGQLLTRVVLFASRLDGPKPN